MHELALANSLVETILDVARKHEARAVTAATLEIGELTCVDPDTLAFAFEVASKDTVANGCQLKMQRIPLEISCKACGHQGQVDSTSLGCPVCGEVSVKVSAGRELRLVSIDVEDENDETDRC